MNIEDMIEKSRDAGLFSRIELMEMLRQPPDLPGTYRIMAEANRISKELTENKAEVHAQFTLNLSPCGCNCSFCSFAKVNGVFERETEITPEEAVAFAKQFEADEANAVFVMTTGNYSFGKFIEISQEIRRGLKSETTLIANIGDQPLQNAGRVRETGYSGVYHGNKPRKDGETP